LAAIVGTGAASAAGYECRVPTRNPERHRDLRLVPGCRVHRVEDWGAESLQGAMAGCGTLVYLVGILNEMGGRTFEQSHVRLVETARSAAAASGITRWLHMSALNANADEGPSEYLRTKGQGEAVAFGGAEQGIGVTSFRPSVIFGRGDSFFNRFAGLLKVLPGPFPLACANARFAPVFVGDVAAAMVKCLQTPATAGETYELCGPRIFTLRELVQYTGERVGRKVTVIPLSDGLARLQGKVFQLLPGKPFSTDNYLSLQIDSVCRHDGLGELGIKPKDVDAIVPSYLG
jgi:NADH dehydrogenase